ncbi:hypothetical protein ASZ78_002873 [Callipepla squamata]|uniref:Thioredoxin-like fold domain-containing protein n=1 Tax=Callipepla squamata TaxID=9009 RepID=A0A226MH17_CALSU|nr:hypothetical protein ASZ78_002873 [Callipepla squamata]
MAGALAEVLGEVLVAADGEEVAVAALAARGVSLVGLYFGCSLSGPCAQLGASLAAFYGRFRGEAAAAGAQRLEIVFVSAEQEQQQWQEAVRTMPWLALPFAEKHRKVAELSEAASLFKLIRTLPAAVLLEAELLYKRRRRIRNGSERFSSEL